MWSNDKELLWFSLLFMNQLRADRKGDCFDHMIFLVIWAKSKEPIFNMTDHSNLPIHKFVNSHDVEYIEME